MNIGIFGGTFDPPHIGHLIAAQDARTALSLGRLIFVPAAEPPHKRGTAVSAASIRLEMLKAAISAESSFEISAIELERAGPSYTVDTLRTLAQKFPAAALHLLIGVDQVREFSSWREPAEIARLAKVVMLARSGEDEAGAEAGFVRQIVSVTRIDVSSTLIRGRVDADRPIRYLVPDAVAEIIAREGLYQNR
ncbi:MAG: nicotinate-nucleotide adenylyltransferase [Gemmatimonadota bacterium]